MAESICSGHPALRSARYSARTAPRYSFRRVRPPTPAERRVHLASSSRAMLFFLVEGVERIVQQRDVREVKCQVV